MKLSERFSIKSLTAYEYIISAVAVLSVLPMFFMPYTIGDSALHVVRGNAYAELFWQGEIFPTWAYQFEGGCGGAEFFFYPPMLYFITALFEPFDFDGKGLIPLFFRGVRIDSAVFK